MKAVDLLVTMQAQQTENHADLVKTVTEGFATVAAAMAEHSTNDLKQFNAMDRRLAPVESMRNTMRWAVGIMFVALATGVVDLFVNHIGK